MDSNDRGTGFKWPVSVDRAIAAPARAVWETISRSGNLELVHPFCASNPVHVWPGPESRDEVHYLSGWVYERHFRGWSDGIGYDLEVGRAGGRRSSVTWHITPVGDDSCSLQITVCPHVLQDVPVVIRWVPYWLWVRPLLRKYLESVVAGVEWFVTRGEPVPRNAFGTHPWFSADHK